MKRILLLIIFFSFIAFASKAEEISKPQSKPRAGYLNLNYTLSKLKAENTIWNNDYGFALTVGRTFYLHRTPLAGMVRIGLDWSFLDINLAQYTIKDYVDTSTGGAGDLYENYKFYQGEIGMHIGPSVTVTPIKNLHISAYFRYAPSFAGYYNDISESFKAAYGSFFVTGASISYKMISFGIEQRWGSAKFKFDLTDHIMGDVPGFEGDKIKLKTKTRSTRFYIGFRF